MSDNTAVMDRGTLVSLGDPSAYALMSDSFDWLRDLTAKGIRSVADGTDVLAREIEQIYMPTRSLSDVLREKDNWVAKLFAEVLSIVELLNPLTIGKQIAVWILEDFRDILRSLAMLVDTNEETEEETQDALLNLGISAAALAIPYVGRAGKVIYRMLPKSSVKAFLKLDTEAGMNMLRYISQGDVLKYLQKLDFPSYAGKVKSLLKSVLDKLDEFAGKYVPKITNFVKECVKKLGTWIDNTMKRIQDWLVKMIAQIQQAVYKAATNVSNSNILKMVPDPVLEWVANQINGNMAESCVDNYLMNFTGCERLYPKGECDRDKSVFFSPDQGLDGVYEYTEESALPPFSYLPNSYNGLPNSIGFVLEELELEIEGTSKIAQKVLTAAASQKIAPYGKISASFQPIKPEKPKFVVMEAKFGYHGGKQKVLSDNEFKNRLDKKTGQMSTKWIEKRLKEYFSQEEYTRIRDCYVRWLYGAQPVKPSNGKRTKSKSGKLMGLAYFPPYALRGFDIGKMK
jgi:predicted metal-dependent hydrolase